ncbi:MAG: HEAT repeat domain-containing protein [Planctomycetes bacterium]|nr:HEAT repeat domain-containing protein [Planctomycetota bacterium]
MSGSTKGSHLVLFCLLLSFFLLTEDLWGHGGRFRGPSTKSATDDDLTDNEVVQGVTEKGISFPGGGPQVAFDHARWEFWWDYNHDPLVGLKSALYRLTPEAGAIDFPFEKVTSKNKIKLIRFLVNLLRKEQDARIREAAVIALARTHDESVLPWLQFAFEDKDLYVQTISIIALGISQIQGAMPFLDSVFQSDRVSTEIRSYAALSPGLIGGDTGSQFYQKWLDPKMFRGLDRFLQQAVAFGAGLTEDPSLGPYLRSALTEHYADDRITNSYLVLSLGRLKDRAANALLINYLEDKVIDVRRSAAVALGITATPSDKDAVESLINKICTDSDNMMRNFCYISLGQIGGEEAEAFLLHQLDEAKRAYLPFVGLAVGLTRNEAYGEKVLKKFKDTKDLNTRSALAVALGLLKCREAVGELRQALDKGGDPIYRGYCALALGMVGDTESVERLTRAYLESNDVELHQFSAMALGLLGDRSITKEMTALLDKSTPDITRLSTSYNLGLIGDQKAIEPLTRIINDRSENERLRSFAVLGLGFLGDERDTPVISKISRNNNYTILDNFIFETFNIN